MSCGQALVICEMFGPTTPGSVTFTVAGLAWPRGIVIREVSCGDLPLPVRPGPPTVPDRTGANASASQAVGVKDALPVEVPGSSYAVALTDIVAWRQSVGFVTNGPWAAIPLSVSFVSVMRMSKPPSLRGMLSKVVESP